MGFLRINDRSCSQFIKAPIVSNNELCDAKFHDVLFNSSSQIRIYFFTCLPMSDEKQLFTIIFQSSNPFELS